MRHVLLALLLLAVLVGPAQSQDAEVTCSWVQTQQRCHTLDGWEKMARTWCDRAQAAKARRETEQARGRTACMGRREARNLQEIFR